MYKSKPPRVERPYPHRPEPPMDETVNQVIHEILSDLHAIYCEVPCTEQTGSPLHGEWMIAEQKLQRLANFTRDEQ